MDKWMQHMWFVPLMVNMATMKLITSEPSWVAVTCFQDGMLRWYLQCTPLKLHFHLMCSETHGFVRVFVSATALGRQTAAEQDSAPLLWLRGWRLKGPAATTVVWLYRRRGRCRKFTVQESIRKMSKGITFFGMLYIFLGRGGEGSFAGWLMEEPWEENLIFLDKAFGATFKHFHSEGSLKRQLFPSSVIIFQTNPPAVDVRNIRPI